MKLWDAWWRVQEQTSGLGRNYVSGQTEGSNLPVLLPRSDCDPIMAPENRLCAVVFLFPGHFHAVTEGQIWSVWVISCVLQHKSAGAAPLNFLWSVWIYWAAQTWWTALRFMTAVTLEQSGTAVIKRWWGHFTRDTFSCISGDQQRPWV